MNDAMISPGRKAVSFKAAKLRGADSLTDWCDAIGLMDEDCRQMLQRIGRYVYYPANLRVSQADGTPVVGILLRGYMRFQQDRADGRRSIVSLITPGDVMMDRGPRDSSFALETATEVILWQFEAQSFQAVVDVSPDLARALYLLQTLKLDQLGLMTWVLGVLTADERVCAFLALATRFMPYDPATGVLTLDLPRGDIADLLGTTVESISRVIKKLAVAGVVSVLGPKGFVINDLPRLIEKGCLQRTFDLIEWPRMAAAG